MILGPTIRGILAAGLLLGGVVYHGVAHAVPIVTLTPTYTHIDLPTTSQVSVTATITGTTGPDDVITFHDVFIAYNQDVLKLDSLIWGNAFQAAEDGGLSVTQSVIPDSYVTGSNSAGKTLDVSTLPANLGTPDTPPFFPNATGPNPDVPSDNSPPGAYYYEGSIRLLGQATGDDGMGNNAADLIAAEPGGQNGRTLFTLLFDVVADQVAFSSIALIDDRNYIESTDFYDWKNANQGNEPIEVVIESYGKVKVPAPGALALLAIGLLGLARSRSVSRI